MLKKVCVLGGSGFVGSHLVNRLNDLSYEIVVPTRSRNGARALWMIPRARVIECDIHNEDTLSSLFKDADAVVNLVSILNENGDDGEGFRFVHQELTRKVIDACKQNHVPKLLYMSALNAHPDAPSHYLKTKGIAENRALNSDSPELHVSVFRPSVIFGPGDSLFNRFNQLLTVAPGVLPLACAKAKFAPVFVGDVVETLLHALDDPRSRGEKYDLCGPDVMTFDEIVTYLRDLTRKKRLILPLGRGPSRLMANIMEFVPGKPLSRDNFRSTLLDNVCPECPVDAEHRNAVGNLTLASIGIEPLSVSDVVPSYILPSRRHQRLQQFRVHASRRSL